MNEYFIKTWSCHVSEKQAEAARIAVQAIDKSMDFVRHYAAGNDAHGWLIRPHDGTNDHDYQVERNRRAVEAVDKILKGGATSKGAL